MSALPTPAYYPRSGSKGALALAHLRAHGRTSRMDLADAIECPAKDLSADIRMCLEHGLIAKEIEVDGRVFYGLGDGVPPATPVEDAPEPGVELAATRWIDLKAEPMAIRALEGAADSEPGETPAEPVKSPARPPPDSLALLTLGEVYRKRDEYIDLMVKAAALRDWLRAAIVFLPDSVDRREFEL